MADNKAAASNAAQQSILKGYLPLSTLPVLYCDGVLNLANNNEVVKFYIYRSDPTLESNSSSIPQPVAQIVMPISSFAQTALFFESALKKIISDKFISQETVEQLKGTMAPSDSQEPPK